MEDLEKQLKALRDQRDSEVFAILTTEQKSKLAELRSKTKKKSSGNKSKFVTSKTSKTSK